jgi:hypothetical protein
LGFNEKVDFYILFMLFVFPFDDLARSGRAWRSGVISIACYFKCFWKA